MTAFFTWYEEYNVTLIWCALNLPHCQICLCGWFLYILCFSGWKIIFVFLFLFTIHHKAVETNQLTLLYSTVWLIQLSQKVYETTKIRPLINTNEVLFWRFFTYRKLIKRSSSILTGFELWNSPFLDFENHDSQYRIWKHFKRAN